MTDHPLSQLPDRSKEPNSKRTLDTWIQQAQAKTGIGAGRLSWMVASSVVVAALQRAVDDTGRPRFLLKGGTYLELRLGLESRSTSDVDGLFRGEFDELMPHIDAALTEPWGPLTFVGQARRLPPPGSPATWGRSRRDLW
ncbi:MAG: nucleotidyl transferase AbiEii/AbiGii toxin family protein [Nitriliruptor sp.]|uniref:nucleotidyl transferase AbiEii/AbiGii toxin family protein n=1 Tax=Nitriliruptor sp. TaxID=2448056 RepID=UPI00349FE7EB